MSVSDGENVNALVTNAAYLSRKTDSDTLGIIGFKHPASGGLITNVQQKINDEAALVATNIANISTNTTDISNNAGDIVTINATLPNKADLVAGKLPVSQLPTTVMVYLGNWDASTNTPTLIDGTGTNGDTYKVSVAGTIDLGSGSISYNIGDWLIYNGTIWEKSTNSNDVVSVNSQTGIVVLDADDIAETTRFWDVKNNRVAIIAPTASDDSGSGYVIGSTWFDTVSGILYLAQDVTLSAAVWIEVQGGGSGVGSVSLYALLNAEDETDTSAWSTGNNATPLIAGTFNGTFAINSTSPIAGLQDYKYTQAAGSLNDWIASPIQSVPFRSRAKHNAVKMQFVYDGAANDIKLFAYDVTNSVFLDEVLVTAETTSTGIATIPYVSNTCTQIRLVVHVLVENIGAILRFDDLQFDDNAFVEKDLISTQSTWLDNGNAGGSSSTSHRRFANSAHHGETTDIYNYVDSATDGAYFEILRAGKVVIAFTHSTSSTDGGILLNPSLPNTTVISSHSPAEIVAWGQANSSNGPITSTAEIDVITGDKIYFAVDGTPAVPARDQVRFSATAKTTHYVTPAKSNLIDATAYTPVTQGVGTISANNLRYGRIGSYLTIEGTFALGTVDANEAQLGLPIVNGVQLTVDTEGSAQIESVGNWFRGITNADKGGTLLGTDGDAFVNFSAPGVFGTASLNPFTVIAGNAMSAAGHVITVKLMVKVSEWSSDATFLAAVPVQKVMYAKDVKANGVGPLTLTSASWDTRELNTLSGDLFGTLSTNQITLPAGKYKIEIDSPFYDTAGAVGLAKFYDTTNAVDVAIGTTARVIGTSGISSVYVTVEISSPTVYEVRHYSNGNFAGGYTFGIGVSEVYTQVMITKLR